MVKKKTLQELKEIIQREKESLIEIAKMKSEILKYKKG